MSRYVPAARDLVWLEFNPQAGHEQAGHRPAIVLSQKKYNSKTGLAIFCPITSRIKGYPFEVPVRGKKIKGAVLADQVKSFDWKVRDAKFIERAGPSVFDEVVGKLYAIIQKP